MVTGFHNCLGADWLGRSTTGNAFKPSECCTYIVASVLKTCGFFQQLHVNKATSRTQHSHTRVGSGQGKARRVQSGRAAGALALCKLLLVDTIDSLTRVRGSSALRQAAWMFAFRFYEAFHIDDQVDCIAPLHCTRQELFFDILHVANGQPSAENAHCPLNLPRKNMRSRGRRGGKPSRMPPTCPEQFIPACPCLQQQLGPFWGHLQAKGLALNFVRQICPLNWFLL